ncbi:ABC transporter substrate-binding protein [Roseateles microcysteis]|uniref:ABC transporter substrate-binding protein n=1 Tax=Roseateles microcysteis TaxID=3119057 RepID=UPI002FE57729
MKKLLRCLLCLFAGLVLAAAVPAQSTRPLVYAMYADIKDWDPAIASSTEVILLSNVYEPLVWYDPQAGKDKLRPGLATAWSVSKDGREWRFTLRQNVRFHDGEPFNAAAAKASIERTRQLAKGSSFIWDRVESISAPDAQTLVIRTKVPAPVDLIASSQYAAYMVSPKAMAAGTAWFNEGRDGGTGPYTVRQWTRGQEVVLDRFDGYWGGWQPGQFQQVKLRVVQEASTQAQLIRSGEADIITLPSADLVKALVRDPKIAVLRGPSWRNTQFLLNTQKAPTNNANFRRALTYAWDYRGVADKIYEGGASPATGPIPATMWGHDSALKSPRLDLAQARRMLEASGVPRSAWKITASYIGTSEEYKNSLLLFKANLEQLGVTLELRPGPWGKIWDDAKRVESSPNLISMTWWPTYGTPSDWLIGLFRSESPTVFNLSRYANPAYDALVNAGVAEEARDRALAAAKFSQAQQLLLDDAVALFVADLQGRVIHRRSLKGVQLNPAYDAVLFYGLSR